MKYVFCSRFAYSLTMEYSLAWKAAIITLIGPLQDPVTWYRINYTGTQMTQWDFQNKEKSGWTGIKEFFFFGRPTALFASQCNLFRAM